jgi:radical SAM protein with 4Fe4S-binding SPASM domain
VPPSSDFVSLAPNCFLKELEEPYIYNAATDDLYEVNGEALEFLKQCDGSRRLGELIWKAEFVDYCLSEDLLKLSPHPHPHPLKVGTAPKPSLRYLELQLTARCNLRCHHCYLGEARSVDLPVDTALRVMEEFADMGGLRLLLSGGEPLLHPRFWEIHEALPGLGCRSILLTNGTLLDARVCRRLRVHQAQVSIDGLEAAHDALRGRGSFAMAVRAVQELRHAGRDVSVATMVQRANRDDFPRLKEMLQELGVSQWTVDVPCVTGHLEQNPDLALDYTEAAGYLKYGYGGGLYTSSPGYACGTHLCAVLPNGRVAKCGFYSDQTVGGVEKGLAVCWARIAPLRTADLGCRCPHLEECRGGCRYRAFLTGDPLGPDPVQCALRGVSVARS